MRPFDTAIAAATLSIALLALSANACSNFAMEDPYGLSARTEDMGPITFDFGLITRPAGLPGVGTCPHTRGYVAFAALKQPAGEAPPLDASQGIKAGLNDAGLSCDKQTLRPTTFPNRSHTLQNMDGALVCRWALECFASAADVKRALAGVNFVAPARDSDFADGHWALRDAAGQGLVVEFVGGEMRVYEDGNDGGATGFGVMTNEPSFPWQLEAMQFLQWKQGKHSPAVSMPGSWYPDARFQRLCLVKGTMRPPVQDSLQLAVARAVHVLNTVTVPMGEQMGKDTKSPKDHHTFWAVIYDHKSRVVYWRTDTNQNLQRLRLEDARLQVGGQQRVLLVKSPDLPWFHDAAGALQAPEALAHARSVGLSQADPSSWL